MKKRMLDLIHFPIPRDAFKYVRSQRGGWFSLRVRVTLIVAGVLMVSVAIATAVYELLEAYFRTESVVFAVWC